MICNTGNDIKGLTTKNINLKKRYLNDTGYMISILKLPQGNYEPICLS